MTTIERSTNYRIEWNKDDKDLLFYICTYPTLKDQSWVGKWTIFNHVCQITTRPTRTQDSLTSTWSRSKADLAADPKWNDPNSWSGMVGHRPAAGLTLYLTCF
jgi:hypothetical protein